MKNKYGRQKTWIYLTKSWVRTILEQEIRVGVRDVTSYVA